MTTREFAQFGSDLDADTKSRLALGERIVEVLKQGRNSPVHVGCQVAIVYAVVNGYLSDVPVAEVHNYEERLYEKLRTDAPEFLRRVTEGKFEEEDVETLRAVLASMQR